jgi:hypothetical protein
MCDVALDTTLPEHVRQVTAAHCLSWLRVESACALPQPYCRRALTLRVALCGQLAGLLLRVNVVEPYWIAVTGQYAVDNSEKAYLRQRLPAGLADPSPRIRTAVVRVLPMTGVPWSRRQHAAMRVCVCVRVHVCVCARVCRA